jgi:16S rRNA processing protein RimM
MQLLAEIQKTFGKQGELIIKLLVEASEIKPFGEPVFVTIDGLPVPFYFKSFEKLGNHRAQVIFDDMESQPLAEELVGKTLWRPGKPQLSTEPINYRGYQVYDQQLGELGEVVQLLDIPGNPCLQVNYREHALLIPFHKTIVLTINHRSRQMETLLPDGLLEL